MRLTAKRKNVLSCIAAYDCYKVCTAVLVIEFVTIQLIHLLLLQKVAALSTTAMILWFIQYGIVMGYGVYLTRYMLSGVVAGSKAYVSVSNCYLQYEADSGLFVCRQITSGGSIEYMEVYKEDIDWLMPDEKPGFYLHLKENRGTSEISTGKKIAYILASAYELEEFKLLYQELSQGLTIRNAGRENKWCQPVRRIELMRCLRLWLVFCTPVLWIILCSSFSLSIAAMTYLTAGILGAIIWRCHGTSKTGNPGNVSDPSGCGLGSKKNNGD